MLCPYCGKIAWWYELKEKGKEIKVRACCEKAKLKSQIDYNP